jgi:pyridoxamine 5'-phosphate oxidase
MVESSSDVAAMRREYAKRDLDEASVAEDPIEQFNLWFEEATAVGELDPNGASLATVDEEGRPSNRIVLLKGVDKEGFRFYTNYRSRKSRDIALNPQVSLALWWPHLQRQVRIEGRARKLGAIESAKYFALRPRGSQLGAWASPQSEILQSRRFLEAAFERMKKQFEGGEVIRPPHWGGYVVAPEAIEFWQGRDSRLHDRIRYARVADGWLIERLAP